MKSMIFIVFLVLAACSQQAIFEGIQQNQCFEKTGQIYCEDKEEYEEYKRNREELLNKATPLSLAQG